MTALLEAFKSIELVKAQAQGFRGFEDSVVVEFTAGTNKFIGDNGKGKTSLGELITWVFTGRSIEGKQKEINVINDHCESAVGIVTFKDQTGNVHELERRQGSSMSLKLNYDAIPQKRLDELVPLELFLCAFNPIYFLLLDAATSRKTILNLFPVLNKAAVLAEMDEVDREALEKEDFDLRQTNVYLKNRNDELKALDDNRKWLEGYIGKLREKTAIPEPKVFDEAALAAVVAALDALTNRKPNILDIKDMLVKKQELQAKMAQVQVELFPNHARRAELLNEKVRLDEQLKAEKEKVYTPFNPVEMDSKVKLLRQDYKRHLLENMGVEEEIKKLNGRHIHVHAGDQCPTCKQLITEEGVGVLQKELEATVRQEKTVLETKQTDKQTTLNELFEQAQTVLAEIAKLKDEDAKKQQVFDEAKDKAIQAIESRLAEISQEMEALDAQEKTFAETKSAQIAELQKEVDALGVVKLEEDNVRIEREFRLEVEVEKTKLLADKSRLEGERDEVVKYEAQRKLLITAAEKQARDLELNEKEYAEFQTKEEDLRKKVYYMKAFNAKRVELLHSSIKKNLKHVEIHLVKLVEATGEMKDVFEIFYKDKPLKICSTSETIKAGLEISEMVCKLSDVQFPVFVDNGESITTYDDPGFQTIEVTVVKDAALSKLVDGKVVEIDKSTKRVKSSNPRARGSRKTTTAPAVTIDPAATTA